MTSLEATQVGTFDIRRYIVVTECRPIPLLFPQPQLFAPTRLSPLPPPLLLSVLSHTHILSPCCRHDVTIFSFFLLAFLYYSLFSFSLLSTSSFCLLFLLPSLNTYCYLCYLYRKEAVEIHDCLCKTYLFLSRVHPHPTYTVVHDANVNRVFPFPPSLSQRHPYAVIYKEAVKIRDRLRSHQIYRLREKESCFSFPCTVPSL
ncbi:unnamed protein product [Acanthosepion pharaonis]|uniref:Uncharacterized protein n=1 Tax=Acanthosepion pharaonis TaxID=158019 RepID=A0A812D237_ACAPH|nr:unnamed protein product [Sepia pharaonis]